MRIGETIIICCRGLDTKCKSEDGRRKSEEGRWEPEVGSEKLNYNLELKENIPCQIF